MAKSRASSAKARASSAKPSKAKTTARATDVPIDIVYVGPTLAADEVRRLLPDADVRGPVAVGDVLRVVEGQGVHASVASARTRAREPRVGRIAIIDGYFERMAAVWHKEILLAIEAGIEVWGAASMGALRAAELAPFGMRGVGAIFERFASCELVADDEVAVAHLPAEYNYRATSVALVDLRAGIERLASSQRDTPSDHAGGSLLDRAERDQLVELARAPFYRDRSWARLRADAKVAGMSAAIVDALGDLAMTRGSQKADDARRLLETMAAETAKSTTTPSTTKPSTKPSTTTPSTTTPSTTRPATTKPAQATPLRVPRTWALAQLRAYLARR